MTDNGHDMTELFSRHHRILEKGMMEFRPFGIDAEGRKIRDASGVTVLANVEYLEDLVGEAHGPEAGREAVAELCRRLNERIGDRAYHVTPAFLRNVWNSYSYEFVCYLGEFCVDISGDRDFQFHVGERKLISPIIQTLGRPFSVAQIYRMFPHFGQKFAKGAILFSTGTITDRSAVLRMRYSGHVYRQFGRYRKACAYLICQSSKAALGAFPHLIHSLTPAIITDRACVSEGDDCCEWEFTWTPKEPSSLPGILIGAALSGMIFTYLRLRHPGLAFSEAGFLSLFPGIVCWLASQARILRGKVGATTVVLQEQIALADNRHEELREAYLEQEQVAVDLKHKVSQLTLLHQTSVMVSSTLERETLIEQALTSIKDNLHFDRVMISFYDSVRRVAHDTRMVGVPDEVASFARSLVTPVSDPGGIEAQLFVQGVPILIADIDEVRSRLHPFTQQLAALSRARTLLAVPLKVKDRIIGSLTVDRLQERSLNEEDLEVMVTVANHLAVALDHAAAYRQIEELNIGLEAKIKERTVALEEVNQELLGANSRLQELDQLKSFFVSTVSHELRTPMTSIKGYVENMLEGIAGELTEKQAAYLARIKYNMERLTRMINDLLDLSRIEAKRVGLKVSSLSVPELVLDVMDSLEQLAQDKRITLHVHHHRPLPDIKGDRDKLNQVLTNLVHNAIKFTPAGGRVSISTDVSQAGAVQICVADTGCGIPSHQIQRVFEKFYHADSAPNDARGAGLGLAIVKSLLELHGGTICVESTLGSGCRFQVTLPCDAGDHSPRP
jgi:signal transduction histidine kinase